MIVVVFGVEVFMVTENSVRMNVRVELVVQV